jgi:hypothetical protein
MGLDAQTEGDQVVEESTSEKEDQVAEESTPEIVVVEGDRGPSEGMMPEEASLAE